MITLTNGAQVPENAVQLQTAAAIDGYCVTQTLRLVQYDETLPVAAVQLTIRNQPYTPPTGAGLNVRMSKPDGTTVYNPCLGMDSSGIVYFAFTQQMTIAAGYGTLTVEITDSGVKNSAPIIVDIKRNPVPEGSVESSDEFLTLQELLAKVEKLAAQAESSAAAAASSETNAKASETAAKTSETNAAGSASTASEKADDAGESASAAAASAAAAKTSETNAKASETAAASSASAAKTSEAAAASSASAAASSETNAANSKTAAADSASAAAGSASAAAGSQKVAEEKAAQATQERVKAEAAAKAAEGWTPDGAVDAIWAARLDGTNTAEIFQQYAAALIAQGVDIDTILRRWFALLWDNNTYGTKLYKFATSPTPDGELIQASAELGAAKPGTNTTAAIDPYFPRGAFWAVEVAYEIENKEPVVKAVVGVNGVDRKTLLSGKFGMVGVAQKTGWVCDTADDNYYYHFYRAAPAYFLADANAYKPLPEGVAVDGSLRPFVIHAKYMAGRGADGKLTSASGLAVVNFISMDGQRAEWKKRGADYCGICGCDLAFRMRMFWAKYGKKGNSGTLEGCSGYNYQYKAAVSETGVTRVIMTADQANSYLVGSTVSVGDVGTGTSTDRGVASMRAKADKVRVLSIEDVTVDGTDYKALNLDTATPFDTEKDKTIVSTMPWHSGSCDNVQGADGSPTSCTSGKEPFIIQLLECQPGGYAISADQLTEQVLDDTAYTHRLVFFRQAAQLATSITADAVRSPIVLTMPTTQTGQWLYEKDVEIDADGNMYPVDAGSGASSTNGCRAAVFVPAAGSRVNARWAWARLADWGVCGLSGGRADVWAGGASWYGLCGACGSGANRGEYAGA